MKIIFLILLKISLNPVNLYNFSLFKGKYLLKNLLEAKEKEYKLNKYELKFYDFCNLNFKGIYKNKFKLDPIIFCNCLYNKLPFYYIEIFEINKTIYLDKLIKIILIKNKKYFKSIENNLKYIISDDKYLDNYYLISIYNIININKIEYFQWFKENFNLKIDINLMNNIENNFKLFLIKFIFLKTIKSYCINKQEYLKKFTELLKNKNILLKIMIKNYQNFSKLYKMKFQFRILERTQFINNLQEYGLNEINKIKSKLSKNKSNKFRLSNRISLYWICKEISQEFFNNEILNSIFCISMKKLKYKKITYYIKNDNFKIMFKDIFKKIFYNYKSSTYENLIGNEITNIKDFKIDVLNKIKEDSQKINELLVKKLNKLIKNWINQEILLILNHVYPYINNLIHPLLSMICFNNSNKLLENINNCSEFSKSLLNENNGYFKLIKNYNLKFYFLIN